MFIVFLLNIERKFST